MNVDVCYLAQITQLTVSPAEAKKLEQGFQQTLKNINTLQRLDTRKIKANFQVTGLDNVWRQDKVDRTRCLTQKQALANAKKTYQGYFVVPLIIYET